MSEERHSRSPLPLRLVRTTSTDGASQFAINGRRFELITYSDDLDVPEYKCISYVWGSERTRNPTAYGPSQLSIQTIPAIETMIESSSGYAFWIDAFCVPTTQPTKRQTLESMGFIYSRAVEVVVMLSHAVFEVLSKVAEQSVLDNNSLRLLNEDPWVKSVWTYQEVVNSQKLAFVCVSEPKCVIEGEDLLDNLGFCLTQYKETKGLDSTGFRKLYPFVDAFEDLLADWRVSEYLERSAMSIMAAMDRRTFEKPEHY